jgi:hypothetical protein
VYAVYLVYSNILTDSSSDNWPYAINFVTTKNLNDIQILLINFKFIAYGQLSLDESVNIFEYTRYTAYTKAKSILVCTL